MNLVYKNDPTCELRMKEILYFLNNYIIHHDCIINVHEMTYDK